MKKLLLSICLGLACTHGLRAETPYEDKKKIQPDPAVERQQRERAEKRRLAYEMQARKYAEAQALLRVDADSGDCLAMHNQRGVCLVNAQAFNRAVGSVEPDDGLGATPEKKRERIRGTRRELLKQMLQGEFLTDALKATGLEGEVVRRAQDAETHKWAQAAKAIGETRLRAIYRRYREIFAARESRVYQVLASTDSLWIDSLSKLPPSVAPRDPQSRVPWVSVPDTLMPPELAEAGSSLKKKKSALTVSWKAGYACIRLASVLKVPSIPFEQALPTLVGLIPYTDPDSLQALQEAQAYYTAHPAEFRNPDTLVLDVALVPGEAANAAWARQPRQIRLQSLELPEQVGLWLTGPPTQPNARSALPNARSALPNGRDSLRVGATLGPVFLGVGTWTFRIAQIRKGAGLAGFEEARDSLDALLQRRRTAQALAEVRDAQLDKNRTLGMRIFEDLLDERHPPEEAELNRRMQADSSELAAMLPRDLPPEKVRENLRVFSLMKLAQARRDQSYESWLKESVTLEKMDPD
ncbi:MAG TPA: peptidylprolyl isomerase [Fibrobacteria bacterium]|nr:peptidylprolyl isomerase [Fibrobacteria bacterium]